MSENGEIYTTGKNFTLPPAVTAWTNSTSEASLTRPAVKMPIIGPLTTPPMTIAASSIPGRYLKMKGWGLAIWHLSNISKPDHESDTKGDSSKEKRKYLGEKCLDGESVNAL